MQCLNVDVKVIEQTFCLTWYRYLIRIVTATNNFHPMHSRENTNEYTGAIAICRQLLNVYQQTFGFVHKISYRMLELTCSSFVKINGVYNLERGGHKKKIVGILINWALSSLNTLYFFQDFFVFISQNEGN